MTECRTRPGILYPEKIPFKTSWNYDYFGYLRAEKIHYHWNHSTKNVKRRSSEMKKLSHGNVDLLKRMMKTRNG